MTCATCSDTGFWPYVDTENPKPDDQVTADDLLFAVCLCETGQTWRRRENEHRKVPPLWLVWCAKNQVNPNRVCMLEDVLTAEQMKAAGFAKPTLSMPSREAALLAAGKGKR